jgi:hypothetical protein
MAITDSDLDICFQTTEFAVEGSFTNPSDPSQALVTTGYFSGGSDSVKIYDSLIEAVEPTFICKAAAIEAVARGWQAAIENENFRVERIERVGTGVATIYLTKRVQ